MKKIIPSFALACVLTLGLTACGGGSSAPAASGAAASTSSKTETAAESGVEATESASQTSEASASAVAGEVFDVGEFTVLIPEGWMVSPQTDMFGEQDEEGNYPQSTTSVGMIKGGESEWDAFSKPTIYVYKNEGEAASQAETTAMFYDETKDIDVTVNGVKCPAFEAKSSGLSEDEEQFYVYDIVFYPVSDEVFFQINVPVDMIDYKGVNVTDTDVMAMMESLTLK